MSARVTRTGRGRHRDVRVTFADHFASVSHRLSADVDLSASAVC